MEGEKIHRLWKPILFEDVWRSADTSILDDLSSAWFARRKRLGLDSKSYQDFLGRLKREHAIETGVVERLYDIDRGVTETLIQQGFIDGLLSHNDANIPSDQLMRHLNDHLEAMDFVFELIKENRQLTTGFIKELHQLVTRNQHGAEGRDSQGNKTKIKLLKGAYKEWENNPTRSDGTVIMYCPPIQVASEMDQLVKIYHSLEEENLHPLIIASWVHHAFTTIHPFQDGNGRVVRLLASLILIKHELFPITVLREEAKLKYILALEKADAGEPSDLVSYFAAIQKRQIERALSVEEVVSDSLVEVQRLLVEKVTHIRTRAEEEKNRILAYNQLISERGAQLSNIFSEVIASKFDSLRSALEGIVDLRIQPNDESNLLATLIESGTIDDYTKRHKIHDEWLFIDNTIYVINFEIKEGSQTFQCVFFLQSGFDDATWVLGTYSRSYPKGQVNHPSTQTSSEIAPHKVSLLDEDVNAKRRNIEKYVENSLAIVLAHLVNDLGPSNFP